MLLHLVGHRARPSLARRVALVLGTTGSTRRRSPCRTHVGRLAVARDPRIPRLTSTQHSYTNGYAQISNIVIDSALPHSCPCEAVHLIISPQVRLCRAQCSWQLEGIQSSVMRYPSLSICRTNVKNRTHRPICAAFAICDADQFRASTMFQQTNGRFTET